MRVSLDGTVDAENDLEDIGEEIEALERELARKQAKRAQLRGEHEMPPEQQTKVIRRTMRKCAKALNEGHISLEQFAGVAAMARGIRPAAGGTFGKSVGSHSGLSTNHRHTVNNLRANGLAHLVSPDGSFR